MRVNKLTSALAIAGLATVSSAAFATDGYFSDGYGMKAKGMAGVSIAMPQDTLAAANNPAGMVWQGDRLDIGVDYFRPIRNAEIVGNGGGANGSYDANDKKNFLIPEFGYNKMINPNMSFGVSVYGNGGMNTSYTKPIPLFSGTTKAGIDLMQLFIAPTFAMKLNANNAIGISLNFAYERFKATGLQNFDNANYSSSPGNVTDKGYDSATGFGVKVGWNGQVTQSLALGATYQSKTNMGKLDKYQGLFAEKGAFDIPESYGAGFSWKMAPAWTLAGDYKHISYSKVAAVGNTVNCLFAGTCKLGADNGAGFGWDDMDVYKLGVTYEFSKAWTWRAGYSYGKQPIPASQTLFNMLAPAVNNDHLTFGATWTLPSKGEVTFAYMHAFENTVTGSASIPAGFGGGNANLKMYQDSFGVAYGIKF
jgi:long-chain fatty acid transport protein